MCGADVQREPLDGLVTGSSPRVRSRQCSFSLSIRRVGIISACAEQTLPWTNPSRAIQDHLRVCGADVLAQAIEVANQGSSPRVRSRLVLTVLPLLQHGIISACAEQTYPTCWCCCWSRDHLRVCGADLLKKLARTIAQGSSPRVRSRPLA